ncbi:MAG: TRAP transporter large permease [Rhizobiaceae bacterium]
MSDQTIGLLALIAVLVMIALRAPIAIALLTVTFAAIWHIAGLQPAISILTSVPYNFTSSWTLSSIPMFLFMGYIAYHSGMTKGLFQAARVWLSWLPGGLAISSIVGCGGFASVTGSSMACSAAVGRIAVPEMTQRGYDIRIATGAVAVGGTLGALIPPSLLLILYGIYAQVSITDLFYYGLLLGISSIFMYTATILVLYYISPGRMPMTESFSWQERASSIYGILPAGFLAASVFGGLFLGIFTATEAGAIGVVLAAAISLLTRSLTWEGFIESCKDTLMSCGNIFLIAIAANSFTRMIALSGISSDLGMWLESTDLGPNQILLIIFVMYLILGMFIDPLGAMLLSLPIILPILPDQGISVIWFGMFLAKLLEMGMISPPVGLNVFVIHGIFKETVRLEQVFYGILPFFIADIILVFVLMGARSVLF